MLCRHFTDNLLSDRDWFPSFIFIFVYIHLMSCIQILARPWAHTGCHKAHVHISDILLIFIIAMTSRHDDMLVFFSPLVPYQHSDRAEIFLWKFKSVGSWIDFMIVLRGPFILWLFLIDRTGWACCFIVTRATWLYEQRVTSLIDARVVIVQRFDRLDVGDEIIFNLHFEAWLVMS